MIRTLRLAAALFLAIPLLLPAGGALHAQEAEGFAPISSEGVSLQDFIWQKRPVVVFADSADDPAFQEQMRSLQAAWPDLAARDVIIITDTEPGTLSDVRRTLRPRGFSIVLIEKDGTVAQRRPTPRNGREIASSIDKMPIRREEIRNAPARQNRVGG
ncbi:DUF4174 domain-containing protein [Paenirhodobacter populi]|uniref:DUF4174 domain-containing protein n=1 Tax=Paenirhodobacter populi TaxID=2306993 RepID=A0A443KG25_9RHOB|nr:DUF4174 domain-containing protein [Sinirhodobacter populi]RWR08672.1 DUF4174 domain-containing protein [Sinirhodobacter populi]RWR12795.1 DUF4174 domain-containing protein [Sinirhodobacter populi]RWR22609.1 DUF4174 domain-containing protein [Sinirhodobacter populi]RWR29937.1 DUF4174 domain-containing protein [Sinirhodobacter populi]RWR31707.1 DUF4174 domain-containing protein [Sinirhodobacter populi]